MTGSGKSFTPLSRMHWANLRRVLLLLGRFACAPVNPGGCRSLHALMACSNAAVLVSSDEPFAIPSMVNSPDASGSGNSLTPLSRMHSANLTALSRLVAFCVAAGCRRCSADAFEQPAPIRATMARAASGRVVYSCVSLLHPWIVRRVGVHGRAAVIDRLRGAVRSARARCRRSGTARTRRRARTATPWHRRARCRPRPPTRERTCWGWPPSGRLPASEPYFETASRRSCSWYSGERQPLSTSNSTPSSRHPSRPGAGRRGELDRGWRHPESRRRRPSCRRGRHRRPRQAHHGARREGRRWAMRPSRTRTPATGSRGPRRSPR